jgi:hypothetical protein
MEIYKGEFEIETKNEESFLCVTTEDEDINIIEINKLLNEMKFEISDPRRFMHEEEIPDYVKKGFGFEEIKLLVWNVWWTVSIESKNDYFEFFTCLLYNAAKSLEPKKYTDLIDYQEDVINILIYICEINNKKDHQVFYGKNHQISYSKNYNRIGHNNKESCTYNKMNACDAMSDALIEVNQYLTYYDWSSNTNFMTQREEINKNYEEKVKEIQNSFPKQNQINCCGSIHSVLYDDTEENKNITFTLINNKKIPVMEEDE